VTVVEHQLACAWTIGLERLRDARPRRLRTLEQFAAEEIVVPSGPFGGRTFRHDTIPWTRLLHRAIDSGRFRRIACTGPSQAGKSLCTWTIPAIWIMCELREPIVLAAPSPAELLAKWQVDLVPVLRATRYRDLLPERGAGSRGGTSPLILMRNGAPVRFMTAAGDDKSRAGFTGMAAMMTEVDGMDTARTGSRESDPCTQIEQRTEAYQARALVVYECTPSTPAGRIWREYEAGTASRVASPCPHCEVWISPEREHLVGWQTAASEIEAEAQARWACPACGHLITDAERIASNQRCVLVHRGQEVDRAGRVTGPEPGTRTLGFRWSAWANLLATTGSLGAREWRAARTAGHAQRDADRALRQFVWAVPAKDRALEETESVDGAVDILDRIDQGTPRGLLPAWTQLVVVGVDVGLRTLYWACTAWRADATVHVPDYGIEDTPEAESEERRILSALRSVRDRAIAGWAWGEVRRRPDLMLVDAGWRPDVVYAFAREPESVGLVRVTKGYGAGQPAGKVYHEPRTTGSVVRVVGDRWHEVRLASGQRLIEFATDDWKTRLQARIESAPGTPGAITLHAGDPRDHRAFSAHLRSERLREEFDPRKGWVRSWIERRAANHWWDAMVLATLGAGMRGVRPTATDPSVQPPTQAEAAPAPPRLRPPRDPLDRPYPILV